jgi:hypothetical protein
VEKAFYAVVSHAVQMHTKETHHGKIEISILDKRGVVIHGGGVTGRVIRGDPRR